MNRIAPFALALLAGCIVNEIAAGAGASRTSPWYETGEVRIARADLIRTIRDLITRNDYVTSKFDADANPIETDWDVHMSPHFRQSFRSKLEIELVPTPGGFNVRTRSWMEINNNSPHPSDPDRAEWVGAGVSDRHEDRINEPAMRFHSMLKIRLFGFNQ